MKISDVSEDHDVRVLPDIDPARRFKIVDDQPYVRLNILHHTLCVEWIVSPSEEIPLHRRCPDLDKGSE